MRQVVHDLLSARLSPGMAETAVRKARLENFTLHSIRHHFASWFMMRSGDLLALQKILGNHSLSMTQQYTHLSPDHLRGAMARTERPTDFLGARSGAKSCSKEGVRRLSHSEVAEVTGAGGGS